MYLQVIFKLLSVCNGIDIMALRVFTKNFTLKSTKLHGTKLHNAKLQSTMEYLITHMWAILIIAIAFVALFLLGVFSPNASQRCILGSSFQCQNYIMNTAGVVSITILRSGSNPVNITGIACYDNNSDIFYSAPNPPVDQVYLPTGNSYTFSTQCYTNQNPYTSGIGGYYSGIISIRYVNLLTGIAETTVGTIIVKPSTSEYIYTSNPGVIYSLQVGISNTNGGSASSGFQQELTINPSSFRQYGENANLSNLEFTANEPIGISGNVPLYSWIESGASNTATSAIIWIKLPFAIGPNSQQNIFMNFLSNNNPVLSYPEYTGYAPELYCSNGCEQTAYGKYDNGFNVFSFYDNFNGTTLDTNKWGTCTSPGATTVDNGYTANTADCIGEYSVMPGPTYPTSGNTVGILSMYVSSSYSVSSLVILCWIHNGGCNPAAGFGTGVTTLESGAPGFDSSIYGIDISISNTITSYQKYTINWFGLSGYPPDGIMPSVSCSVGVCSN